MSKVLVSRGSDTWALGCVVFDVFTSGEGVLVNDPTGLFLETGPNLNAAASSSTKKASDAEIADRLKNRAETRVICTRAGKLVCACTDFDVSARGRPEDFLATLAEIHAGEARMAG